MSGGSSGGRWVSLLVGLVVLSSTLAWIFTQNPGIALLPVVLVAAVWAVFTLPLHWLAGGVLFLVIGIDIPDERPMAGNWESPTYPIGHLLFDNLHPLPCSLMEVILYTLILVAVLRRGSNDSLREGYAPVPGALKLVTLVSFSTIVMLEVYGIARGGGADPHNSLWQLRWLLMTGPAIYFFSRALRGPKDAVFIGKILLFAGYVKAFWGSLYWFGATHWYGLDPAYVNTHSDTVLYVTVILMLVLLIIEKRTFATKLVSGTGLPLFFWMLYINNRRLAYASMIGCLLAFYFIIPKSRIKQRVNKFAYTFGPIFGAYVAVGKESTSKVFIIAAKIGSMFSSKDASTAYRDNENFNLIATMKQNPVIGTGFGHEFLFVRHLDNIANFFSLVKFIPHNSVLWQWSLGGVIGFTLIWMPLWTGIYLAARSFHYARVGREKTIALVCLAVIICDMNQQFGDMGSQSWIAIFMYATAVAMAGKLAVTNGAWALRPVEQAAAYAHRPARSLLPQPVPSQSTGTAAE